MVKSRLYDGDAKAAWTIHRIVRDFECVQSYMSIFTHHISQTIYGVSAVDIDKFPHNPLDTKYDQARGDLLKSKTFDLQLSTVRFGAQKGKWPIATPTH